MSVQIDLPQSVPYFDLQVQLDDVTYTLEFRWNQRAQAWFMNVYDEAGTTLLMAGQRVVVTWPIGAYFSGVPWPGALMFFDTVGPEYGEPGINDLGSRVQLFYFSLAETGG